MTTPAESSAHLQELLTAACDERMTPEQCSELDALIRENPAVRVAYLKQTQLEANLRRMLRVSGAASSLGDTHGVLQALAEVMEGVDERGGSLHDAMIMPALAEDTETIGLEAIPEEKPLIVSIEREDQQWGYRISRSIFAMCGWRAAAAVLLVVLLGIVVMWSQQKPAATPSAVAPTPLATATLAQAVDAQWDGVSPRVGDSVEQASLHLKNGLAKITFPNGASVVLQGPARLQMDSDSHVTLMEGRLTTHVPASASGFTVQTPFASMVDLGTEFGVDVKADQKMHAEVFTGRAAVLLPAAPGDNSSSSPPSSPPDRVLTKDMAVQVRSGSREVGEATPQPLAFVRVEAMQDRVDAAGDPFARWKAFSKQLAADPHIIAYYPFDSESRSKGLLLNRAARTTGQNDGQVEGATWEEGRFSEKSGLRFDGSTSRVHVDIAGRFRQATFAAWVNIRQYPKPYSSLICSDNQMTPEIAHWVFSQKFAPLGLELSILQPDGATWIRNYHYPLDSLATDLDHWHFLATSYDADAKVVRSWFDGKPAGTVAVTAPQSIAIGSALIGCWNNKGSYYRGLMGKMDELAIWDRPLGDSEIQAMYDAGGVR